MDACPICGEDLPPKPDDGRPGRRREYCSDRCRVAAYRRRRELSGELTRFASLGDSVPAPDPSDPPVLVAYSRPSRFESQVVAFVQNARRIAAQGDRLGHGSVPQLAARCASTAGDLFASLERHFPGSGSW